MGVLKGCKPRDEVLKGDLEDAIFAADFGNLIDGTAPKVYKNTKAFFQNTHPAQQLRKVIETVFGRLSDAKEAGATIRLSTGFGGGKTHTLMAMWHLAKNIDDAGLGTELLPAAGRPQKITIVAVDAGKAGVPLFSTHGKTKVNSLHGEIIYQLGGASALKALGKADNREASPNEKQIEAAFPQGPVLMLLDELVIYMARLSERGQGNLLGFLNSLASVVSKRPQTVLVVTDPAGQVAYAVQSAQLKVTVEKVAPKLDDMFDRKVSDFDPIGGEGAKVIVRRLFEKVDQTAAQAASASYLDLYKRVMQEHAGQIRPSAAGTDYANRILECYPFHPRLIETAEGRLGAIQDFQKSRGILRLFARIIRDVWNSDEDHDLISAGEIDWSSPRIQADLLSRLNKDNFKAAILSDVETHASELDGGPSRGIHRRVASALLLESLPLQSNSGLDPAELTLAVLRPEEAGNEPSEALDRLLGVCWHTYPMPGGRGWQFRYEPNILKQIEEHKAQIPIEDAKARVLAEVQEYFSGPVFKLAAWPQSAKQVSEAASLQLVLCENVELAKAVCAYADDTSPQEPMPRRFLNSIFAVAPSLSAFNEAVSCAQRLMAAVDIEHEHREGELAKLVRDQMKRIKPELIKQSRLRSCRAFDKVVFAGGMAYSLDEQYQVSDEEILQRAQGQKCLRRFLDDKGLIYQPTDALDTKRFLDIVLKGATPLLDNAEVYTAKSIHERFLSAPSLRLVPDGAVVRQTLLKALSKGKVVVRLPDGRAYDSKGCVEGPPDRRRRIDGSLTTLALEDTVRVTRAASETAGQWLEVPEPGKEKKGEGGKDDSWPPPPPSTEVEATTWDKVREYALGRALLKLTLAASSPAGAKSLATLAQPLGAESLSLTVKVDGMLKKRGAARLLIEDVDIAHPTNPLAIAQTLFNALGEGSFFEADLTLEFGKDGRTGLLDALARLEGDAPDDVTPRARFGKPLGGSE